MTSEIVISLSPEQVYILIAAFGGVVYWITRKITKLEDRIKIIEKSPLFEVFRKTEIEMVSVLLSADNIIKGYEAKKVSSKKEEEEKK